ncbi:non-ribosomal peptide synthetase [Photobacterium lutimaris]|uniref:Non-ribosomal peptide synthetase n=1 Tax=Photobacterium lutimaris TaxID=388278 RepID=A0A2T3IYK8_9GAMM|nr:non-ribosomal peptide synthetase [Photobacterium lutimaris]PSU33663.1 non-ribosomal peptide synthetase [Photobacterium lutimaris]TDR74484.1 amino acid adenylation domain-containing protein [Photobacterium lutimaris]
MSEISPESSAPDATLRDKLSKLSAESRAALLKKIRQTQPRQDKAELPLAPKARFEPFPLTEVQEAYWVGRREGFDLGEIAAHGYMEVDCQNLDLPHLNRAWNQLVKRHDMLRAVVDEDGRQRVLPEVPEYQMAEEDLCECAAEDRDAALLATRGAMSHQVFDTETWPLFDMRISHLSANRARLHISLDVLILDAWSLDILSSEWEQLYRTPGLEFEPLEASFRDYVNHKHSKHQGQDYQEAQAYWQERVDVLPAAPELPIVAQKTQGKTSLFSRRSFRLDREEWSHFGKQCRSAGVTPSVALLAAYATVLATWSKDPHFTLNLTLFDRHPVHPQVNMLVGDFTSVVLLEVDMTAYQSFKERANKLQTQLWQDIDYSLYSGVDVIRDIARRNDSPAAAAMPMVFTSAISQSDSVAPFSWLGEENYVITQTPQVWLDCQIALDRGMLVVDWDAVEDVFPAGMLDNMFSVYQQFVRRLAADAQAWQEQRVSLTPREHQQLVAKANDTATPVRQALMHQLFERQAQCRADNTAVVHSDRSLTYRELDSMSDQVAHYLIEQGLEANQLVAVVMEKSWQQVVAVLAILKAGAAYVPIDPALPESRCMQLLEQSEAKLALCQQQWREAFDWPNWVSAAVMEDTPYWGKAVTKPNVGCRPTDLAYVIFTSGSTGMPKGVMIDHQGAVNTLLDINERLGVTECDSILSVSSLSFDLSVYDIFGLLAAGGKVIVPDASRRVEAEHWQQLIAENHITLWNTVPTLYDLLITDLQADNTEQVQSLRHVMMSGDWIPVDLPQRSKALLPDTQLLSLGGATEASIWSISYPIVDVAPDWTSIPYGKALKNQTMQVLSSEGVPCPVWVPGEICIGGIGLSLGYWKDKEKTNAAFVTNPFSGERIYRTGDLGRLLPDGNIEFLGRKDFQVKLQGHRIELGEIEAVINQMEEVSSSVVTVYGDSTRNKRLVAYVVPATQAAFEAAEVSDDGVILDAGKRLAFRLARHGIRQCEAFDGEVLLGDYLAEDHSVFYSRRTHRQFAPTEVKLAEFAALIEGLAAIDNNGQLKYRFGSAGGLYPVQAYVYVKPNRIEGIVGGIYYFHPERHSLVPLNRDARIQSSVHDEFNRQAVEQSAFSIFLIAQEQAITPLYGHHAEDFCLIEAGLISQLLETEAETHNLGLCQIGAFDFSRIAELFNLDSSHRYLHMLVGGPIKQHPAASNEEPVASHQTASLPEKVQYTLAQKLPRYMVPGSIMMIDALPLSANGKVDRKSLPEPESDRTEQTLNVAKAAPSSDIEKVIAQAWAESLGLDSVGIDDNFFDIGGNSVQMVQVHNRLKRELLTDMTLVEMFFTLPSIRLLAQKLSGEKAVTTAPTRQGRSVGEKRRLAQGQRRKVALERKKNNQMDLKK